MQTQNAARPARRRASSPLGSLLKQWRERRRMSQLDLALESGISSRHLSSAATARSAPELSPARTAAVHRQLGSYRDGLHPVAAARPAADRRSGDPPPARRAALLPRRPPPLANAGPRRLDRPVSGNRAVQG